MKLLRFILKWTLILLLLLAALAAALVLFKDSLLRPLVEKEIRTQTGMEARIGRFETSVLSPAVHLENLRLYNKPEFGGSPFLNIAELHVEYDPEALRRGKLGFKLVRFGLAELNLVRNEAGKMNLDSKALSPKAAASGSPGKSSGGQFKFGGIGTLNLSLGKVRYTDMKTPANNREVNLGVRDEVFKNIRTEDELYGVLMLLLVKHGVNL